MCPWFNDNHSTFFLLTVLKLGCGLGFTHKEDMLIQLLPPSPHPPPLEENHCASIESLHWK